LRELTGHRRGAQALEQADVKDQAGHLRVSTGLKQILVNVAWQNSQFRGLVQA
jgi:hypothetical protein